jgi:hypothetical protein
MPTFIDESGDTGHSRDSSRFFRLSAVWLPTQAAAAAFRTSIRHARQQLGLPKAYEFKFVLTYRHPSHREALLKAASEHGFRFAACSIDKTAAYWANAPATTLHQSAATSLATDLKSLYHLEEAKKCPLREPIFVDNNQDKSFLACIDGAFKSLRSKVMPAKPMVAHAKFRDSKADEMLQLADLVCGCFGADVDGDHYWFGRIEQHCVGKTIVA